MTETLLEMRVIYDNPSDYPGKFVVRKFFIGASSITPDSRCEIFDTLKQARTSIPEEAIRIDREPGDDPVIVESWI